MSYKTLRIFIILLSFGLAIPAFAQTPPPGQSPEAMGSRYQAQVEKEKKALEKKKVRPAKIEVKEEAEKPIPEGPSFILKEVSITGVTIFNTGYLKPLYVSYLNKSVTLKDLETIAKKIEAVYDEKGYLTTNAYIPEQQIKDGKVEIRVIEGKTGDLKVEGNKWFPADLLKKYFHVKKNEVLNVVKLERDALRINQNPDAQVGVVLEAAKVPGTSDIILKEADKFPYHVGVGVDNQGTRLTGNYRTSFSFRSSDLTAHNDSLFINSLVSPGAKGEFAGYAFPLDTYGAKLGFEFSYFTTKLGKEFSSFNITGDSFSYAPHVTQEMYLSETFQADIDYGLEFKSIKKYFLGNKTTEDELRMPYLAFDLSNIDSFFGGGQNTFSPKFTFSTAHFLGASSQDNPEASRQDTGGFFFKYEHSVSRIQKMPFESILSIHSSLQLSSRTLPASEQFQLGGANSIRGYPEGDYLADSGANLNIEWLFPSYFIPKDIKLPYADRPLRNQLQPIAFLDLGWGGINKVMPGELKEKFLMGIGGGLRFNFNRNLSLCAEWAQAIGDSPTQGTGPSNFHLLFRFET